jgi:hypothetical protein
MRLRDKRERQALKTLTARKRVTAADLAAGATVGERRLPSDEAARLGSELAAHFVKKGIARRVGQTSIFDWVPPM